MNAKTCPACKKTSYSSNTFSSWTCPYCNKDLTYQPLEPLPSKSKDKKLSEQEGRI